MFCFAKIPADHIGSEFYVPVFKKNNKWFTGATQKGNVLIGLRCLHEEGGSRLF